MYLSGLSYGAHVPSLDMQRRKKQFGNRRLIERREQFAVLAPLVLAEVHPGNFGALPPSPEAIVNKGYMLGLVNVGDAVADLTIGFKL